MTQNSEINGICHINKLKNRNYMIISIDAENIFDNEKPICRSGSSSQNWTWNNRLVPNRKRSTSRLYIVTLNLYAEYIMRNAGLEETQLESRLPGEVSITSDMQMTPPLWHKVKRN